MQRIAISMLSMQSYAAMLLATNKATDSNAGGY